MTGHCIIQSCGKMEINVAYAVVSACRSCLTSGFYSDSNFTSQFALWVHCCVWHLWTKTAESYFTCEANWSRPESKTVHAWRKKKTPAEWNRKRNVVKMSNAAVRIPVGLQIDTDKTLGQRANRCKETGDDFTLNFMKPLRPRCNNWSALSNDM